MPRPRWLDAETRARLRYVRVPDGALCLDDFPDFLIPGPQRTGTTWLWENLRVHPQILMAKPKELYFFSRLVDRDHPRRQSDALEWYLAHFRAPEGSAVCARGEATASYAALDRSLIEEIALLNPELRAILIVRDPIERAWSHARKDLTRCGRPMEAVPAGELHAFLASDYQRRCAAYADNVARWSASLGRERLLLRRFRDLGERPLALLQGVARFLGVDDDPRHFTGPVESVVNATAPAPIPRRHREWLEDLLADELARLERLPVESF